MKRLDKILSDAGAAGRRELKTIIRSGRVSVNGVAVLTPDAKVDETSAVITLDGAVVRTAAESYYIMDKPSGVVTATEDRAQKTVLDLLPPEVRRLGLFPVGRLDKDTTGLLLLTNDGNFAHRIISPKSHLGKRYLAVTDGIPNREDVEAFAEGMVLKDGTQCLPAVLEITGTNTCWVTIREGKYHQVKRMLAARGKPVLALRRLSIGGLVLDESLGLGGFRELSEEERQRLLQDPSL